MSNQKRSFKLNNKNRYSKTNLKDKSDEITSTINNINKDDHHHSANINSRSGITISPHGFWPDLPQSQRADGLFLHCILFLYSILALFLQYLNLYKTLWWLPNSHVHYSLKFHLINPYLLSCIGLLLGFRVTICFWETISQKIAFLSKGQHGWNLFIWKFCEYTIKIPLIITILSSFLFSFSRVYSEFHFKTITYFVYPIFFLLLFFHQGLMERLSELIPSYIFTALSSSTSANTVIGEDPTRTLSYMSKIMACFEEFTKAIRLVWKGCLIDLEAMSHFCTNNPAQIQEEANVLLMDFIIRLKCCIFTGFLTAYFSILMPRIFIPQKTRNEELQYMLTDEMWIAQLFIIVALTSFSLYASYLFPIQYFDLMHRCALHLGFWEKLRDDDDDFFEDSAIEYRLLTYGKSDGEICAYNGEYYKARAHSPRSDNFNTIAAEPNNEYHMRLYKLGKDPVVIVTYMCLFQAFLVIAQFWLLILTTDWQHIVTLVLLMFANYLLLAKIFKDRIVIGRIYSPTQEDQHLMYQSSQ